MTFFDYVRPMFSGGKLNQSQVDAINAFLTTWDNWVISHPDVPVQDSWKAYCFATVFHETAQTMQPIAEYGRGLGRDYGVPDPVTGLVYYGRGWPQLTWKSNYQLQGARLGIDLERNPDLMLEVAVSADVMFTSMAYGLFTGRRLGQFFGKDPKKDNPIGARSIVNGTDQAMRIAGYFRSALIAIQKSKIISQHT